jgi:hypothetical protein
LLIDGLIVTSEDLVTLGLTIFAILMTLWLFTRAIKGRKKWFSYLNRGIFAIPVALSLVYQLIVQPEKGSNFPVYLGYYFLLNGVLSLQVARSASEKSGESLAAAASIAGGFWLIINYPFNIYRLTGVATDLGRVVFSAIVIVIGLLQVRGAVRMTPQPIVKHADLAFGFLEVILGLVVIVTPIDWEANAVALVWVVLTSVYMFYVASRLHG